MFKNHLNVSFWVLTDTELSTWVEPVSWFSTNVTDLEGHHPITPGGFPWESRRRQNSLLTASYKKVEHEKSFVVKNVILNESNNTLESIRVCRLNSK